ncbi:hypothetical protein BJX70DRAFT_22982 [Aspergillus crustosus]
MGTGLRLTIPHSIDIVESPWTWPYSRRPEIAKRNSMSRHGIHSGLQQKHTETSPDCGATGAGEAPQTFPTQTSPGPVGATRPRRGRKDRP